MSTGVHDYADRRALLYPTRTERAAWRLRLWWRRTHTRMVRALIRLMWALLLIAIGHIATDLVRDQRESVLRTQYELARANLDALRAGKPEPVCRVTNRGVLACVTMSRGY